MCSERVVVVDRCSMSGGLVGVVSFLWCGGGGECSAFVDSK